MSTCVILRVYSVDIQIHQHPLHSAFLSIDTHVDPSMIVNFDPETGPNMPKPCYQLHKVELFCDFLQLIKTL